MDMLIYDSIDKSLTAFNFKSLQECVTLLVHIDQQKIPVADVIEYMEEKKKKGVKPQGRVADRVRPEAFSPKCPVCSKSLDLRESASDGFESVLYCRCGYEHHTEISVVDWQELIRAKMDGKDPDFSIKELRASPEERKRRRVICKTCDYLTVRNTCKACGCRMKHRTYYKILTCPKKYW